jgi:DNA-binding MarR family transcriptional regulator
MSQRPVERAKVLTLSRRDIEDAKRLLSMLASTGSGIMTATEQNADAAHPIAEALSRARALEVLAFRRRREQIFGRAMFGEPAWEMLLLLYGVGSGQRQTVTRLAELAQASKSTAIRWLDYLEGQGWICRESHPTDKRSTFVGLTEKGTEAIKLCLNDTV